MSPTTETSDAHDICMIDVMTRLITLTNVIAMRQVLTFLVNKVYITLH